MRSTYVTTLISPTVQGFHSVLLRNLLIVQTGISEIEPILQYFEKAFDWKTAKEGELVLSTGVDEEYDGLKNQIADCEQKLDAELQRAKEKTGIRQISFRHISREIYQLEIPAASVGPKNIPSSFQLVSQSKQVKRYYTPTIITITESLKQHQEELEHVLSELQSRLYSRFDQDLSAFSLVVSLLSQLDLVFSLAHASISRDGKPMCRPLFVEAQSPVLKVESLRHPTVSLTTPEFIPNSMDLGGSAPPVICVTGPNCGGKSTIIRQTCLAVILAQVGCYVPAESCVLSPVDRIFTRIGASDNLAAGLSTFMVELSETSAMLRHGTEASLMMLDELGRGTSTFDGYAIAYAVMMELANRLKCRTLFSTHYHMLTDDFSSHPSVSLQHMACLEDPVSRSVTFLYKLARGVAPSSHGRHVACMANLPPEVISRAEKKAEEFLRESSLRLIAPPLTSHEKNIFTHILTEVHSSSSAPLSNSLLERLTS
eukprot:GCRY01004047.1.p1 GENE.GCRY01004047.1~~GCRY01004047.1.p1  ORF type:complete len:485 (+),score=153.72 GCRY01004047.1:116-1570(+)